jgi:hypothetical protein
VNACYCIPANQKTVTARRRQMRRRVGPPRVGHFDLRAQVDLTGAGNLWMLGVVLGG